MASHWPSWDCRHHWHLFKTWGKDSYWHSCPGGDGQPHLVLWFGHSVSPKRPVHWNLGHRCKQCSEVALRSIDCLSGTLSSSKTPSLHRLLEGDDTGGGQGSGNCRNRVMGDVPWKDTIYPQPLPVTLCFLANMRWATLLHHTLWPPHCSSSPRTHRPTAMAQCDDCLEHLKLWTKINLPVLQVVLPESDHFDRKPN